jgi:hypothetical protein
MMTLAALLCALARNLLSKSMEETIRRVRGITVLKKHQPRFAHSVIMFL